MEHIKDAALSVAIREFGTYEGTARMKQMGFTSGMPIIAVLEAEMDELVSAIRDEVEEDHFVVAVEGRKVVHGFVLKGN